MPHSFVTEDVLKINTQQSKFHIKVHSILFIQADSNYSYIHDNDGTKIFTSMTLKYWLEKLNSEEFIVASRTYLVSKKAISNHKKVGRFMHFQLVNDVSIKGSRRCCVCGVI